MAHWIVDAHYSSHTHIHIFMPHIHYIYVYVDCYILWGSHWNAVQCGRHTRPERKAGKTRRPMASERQINSLPGLLAVKMIRQQISLANRPTHQSTTLTNERSQWRTRAEHCRLKNEQSGEWMNINSPHWMNMNIHKNIPVSVTKLTLGLGVGFISSHLTADKLFPVNQSVITGPPKMSLLLQAKSKPALIIKPSIILVTHMMTLVGA